MTGNHLPPSPSFFLLSPSPLLGFEPSLPTTMRCTIIIVVLIATTVTALSYSKPAVSLAVTSINASSSTSSLPDINYGLTDEEFHAWLSQEVANCPGRKTYSSVYEESLNAIVEWRKRYRGNPLLWKRIFKKERIIKELVESAPIIELVKKAIDSSDTKEKYTVVDLCSGKGYLSMFLSEILPPEKVERCVLVDKAWAIASKETTELKPHHMNWDHIYGVNPVTDDSYFTSWPIKLYTSKQGKDSCNRSTSISCVACTYQLKSVFESL